jgi:hypothetical protein
MLVLYYRHCSYRKEVRKVMKRALKWIAVLIGVLVVAAVALVFLFDANRFRPALEARLKDALHRDVKLGNLSLSLFTVRSKRTILRLARILLSARCRFFAPKQYVLEWNYSR